MHAAADQKHRDENFPGTRKPPVVALIRVSTAGQARDDRGGVPRQRRVVEQTIRAKCLDCLNIYEISDVSGTDVLRNPSVCEILELVRSRTIRGLVVADLDRLFRPTEPTDYAILQVFKDTDATIYSGDVEYRLGTKDGQLLSGIRSAISAFEIQLMKDRHRGAAEEKRKLGFCPTNYLTLPFGTIFNRATQRWEWTDKAAIVAEVFQAVDAGERNYSRLGKHFAVTGQTIRNWLRNPIYTGWKVWSQKRGEKRVSRTGKTYRVKVHRSEAEVIRVKVLEPLISEEQWNRVQRIADQVVFNHVERLKRDDTPNYAAGGMLICGLCGERCYCSSGKRTDGRRHGYVMCRRNYYLYRAKLGGCSQPNLPQPFADELIEAFACKTLTNAKTLTEIIENSLQRMGEIVRPFPGPAPGGVDPQALRKREKRLLDAYEAGEIELDELRRRREEIRKLAVATERSNAEETRRKELNVEQFVRLVIRGAHRLRRITDRKEKKELIHSLFELLIVKDDAITGFKLRADLRTALPTGNATADGPIYLPTPFRLRPVKEELPLGTKQCIHCEEISPSENFRLGLNRCRSCVGGQEHQAYLRRKTAKHACNLRDNRVM